MLTFDCFVPVVTVIILTVVKLISCLGNTLDISLTSNQARTLLDLPQDRDILAWSKSCMNVFLPTEFAVELMTIRSSGPNSDAILKIDLLTTNSSNELDIILRTPTSVIHIQRNSFTANHFHLLGLTLPHGLSRIVQIEKIVPPCPQILGQHNPRNTVCGNIVSCVSQIDLPSTDAVLVRRKRQVLENATTAAAAAVSANDTASTTESKGLSGGALAAAIVVPILVVGLLAVGGYFLYRWLRSRRTEHGVYQPKDMENRGNFMKQPDPQSVIKVPTEERLI